MKIGLVPMSAKPYHAGHDGLVRLAANECQAVQLFVSLSDRKRPGELPIYGKDMKLIWKKYIEPTLPGNCLPPIYSSVISPIGEMFKFLEGQDKTGSEDTFVIYSDTEDIKTYTDSKLMQHTPTLVAANQIKRRGIDRNETTNISGTKMRQFLSSGNIASFTKFLPTALQSRAQEIYELLSGQRTNV